MKQDNSLRERVPRELLKATCQLMNDVMKMFVEKNSNGSKLITIQNKALKSIESICKEESRKARIETWQIAAERVRDCSDPKVIGENTAEEELTLLADEFDEHAENLGDKDV